MGKGLRIREAWGSPRTWDSGWKNHTLGVAKSRLWGEHAPVGKALGDLSWLYEKESGATIGAAVRTRPGTRPVYVSPGHRMDLPHAIELTLATCRGYRLPEPLRLAHRLTQPEEQPPLF
jgi:deoxyribonuclease V